MYSIGSVVAGTCQAGLTVLDESADILRDVEAVAARHDFRVAMRRIAASVATFRPFLPGAQAAALKQEVRQVRRLLAPARDLDVLLAETLPAFAADGADSGAVASLREEIARRRVDTLGRLATELTDTVIADLRASLLRWSPPDGTTHPAPLDRPVAAVAREVLRRQLRRVGAKRISGPPEDPEALHDLRTRVRALRYALELVTEALKPVDFDDLRKPLLRLQDTLGLVNDAWQAEQAARDLGRTSTRDGSPALVRAAGLLEGWSLARRNASTGVVPARLDAFRKRLRHFPV